MSLRIRLTGATLSLSLPLLALGCQPDTTCEPDGTACGGDPTGTWTVAGACRDPVFARPVQTTYLGQPVEMARQPNPVMASSDWCAAIFFGGTTATAFAFPHDTLSVTGGQISYAADGTFQAVVDTGGPGGVDLSAACLTRSGAGLTCDQVAAALTDFAAQKPSLPPGAPCSDSPDQPVDCKFYYSYSDIRCAGNPDGGCCCTYGVAFAATVSGRWSAGGGVLNHFEASRTLPTQVDYCVDAAAGTLASWGHNRTSILDQDGLRTLKLQKAP